MREFQKLEITQKIGNTALNVKLGHAVTYNYRIQEYFTTF